jgi:hypothetical protein
MSLGGNSPARQSMLRTSMPTGCGVLCVRPAKNGDQIGAAPPTVRGVSPLRLELPHVGLSQVACQCPLLALLGHPNCTDECPLSGVKRT